MTVGTICVPFSLYVLKEAALSGGSYLGCLQSVKKKTEAPFGLAFSGSRSMALVYINRTCARYLRSVLLLLLLLHTPIYMCIEGKKMSKIKCHIKLNHKLAMSASLAFWTLSRRQPRA